ncbi:MAG: hypothetical protein AAB721_01365 [Patescibacteria group bacterium]
MVNTVGSYENMQSIFPSRVRGRKTSSSSSHLLGNKHWHKKWTPIKKSLVLNKQQKDLVIGSLLGDGTMWLGKGAQNVNFKVEHGLAQKEYVQWKYQILKPFVFTEPKMSYRNDSNGKPYEKSWWFRTIRHPELTEIYKSFYKGSGYKSGRKVIPVNLKLNPLVLAIWVMDDGSYSKGKIDISTYCFSLQEIHFLQGCFKNAFNIEINYYADRDKGYRMYCNQQETKKLIKTIRPHIIPSMMYKIGFRNPVTTGFSPLEKAK